MEIIEDISSSKEEIIDSIKKYGSVREHNFWFYYNQQSEYARVYFFKFGDFGIKAIRYDSGKWEIIGDLIAPKEKRKDIFDEFLNYVFDVKKDKRVFAFVPEDFWNEVSTTLNDSPKYRLTYDPIVYQTPVFDMSQWSDGFVGKKWKKLRNIRNRFSKAHNMQIVPSKEVDKKKLIDIVIKWRKTRPNIFERTYYTGMYINFIRNDFQGTDVARSILINGEPCSITAGWKIPNSNNYYSAIGLSNYKFPGLGEIANIDDLTQIKDMGYKYADFGDSQESLLNFKKKFGPSFFYKTYWFHIVRR